MFETDKWRCGSSSLAIVIILQSIANPLCDLKETLSKQLRKVDNNNLLKSTPNFIKLNQKWKFLLLIDREPGSH